MKIASSIVRLFLCGTLAAASVNLLCPVLGAQQSAPAAQSRTSAVELAGLFNIEYSKVAQTNGNKFLLLGGGLEGAAPVTDKWSLAGAFTGNHVSDMQNHVPLSKVALMVGPRYTIRKATSSKRPGFFLEGLVGVVHGFDSLFPKGTQLRSATNAMQTQVGGGMDFALGRNFALRLPQVSWVHSNLGNNAGNSQNSLAVAFGIVWHK